MLIGYARVSTGEQNLDLQIDALKRSGCDQIFTDKLTGSNTARPGLIAALDALKAGDMLMVWKQDRLSRDIADIDWLIKEIKRKGAMLFDVTRRLELTRASAAERLTTNIASSVSQYEREVLVERTKAGMQAARDRGVRIGRPMKIKEAQVRKIQELTDVGHGYRVISRKTGLPKATIQRVCQKLKRGEKIDFSPGAVSDRSRKAAAQLQKALPPQPEVV